MADNVIDLAGRRPVTTEHYFGGCPKCGDMDGFLNLGREHWFFCDKHKTKWCAGSNLFSGWREETEKTQTKSRYQLANYIEVTPVYPPPDDDLTPAQRAPKPLSAGDGEFEGEIPF